MLAVYLCVCQHCDHLTRERRSWSLCWPSTWVSVNIVITSRGKEGACRCAGRLPVCLSTLWSSHEEKKELVAVLAVYLSVCQHCDHLSRGRRSWSLCRPSTCVSVNIVITSRGEEGASRCAGRLPVCLSNIVITSRREEGIGRCAGRLPVCLSTLWSPHEGKKELVAVLTVYLCVCQHCDHLTRGRRSWSLCWPSTWVSVDIVITSWREGAGCCAGRLPECLSTLWSPHEGKKALVAVLAVYLCVCQHCDHLTRGRRRWLLWWPSTWVSVNIVITSRGEEGAGRCAGRLPVSLSNIVITSRGEEGAGRCAGHLPMCLSNIVITWRGEEGIGRCAGRLPVCLSTLWSPHEGKKEVVAVLAVYLCVCQYCDHLTRGRRTWSLCWPSTCVSVNIVITSRGEEGAGRCAGRLPVCLSNIVIASRGEEGAGRCAGRLPYLSVNIVIISRGEEGAGRCAGRLPECLPNIVITSRGEEGAGRCAARLPVCLSTLWSPHERNKKELLAVLAVYLCVCQHCDHLTRGRRR